MKARLTARILLVILILAMAALACGGGGSGGGSGNGTGDQGADVTATYGAEMFHAQLTAMASQPGAQP